MTWSLGRRVAFRLVFAYFFLSLLAQHPAGPLEPLVSWTAAEVFQLPPLDRTPTGSGDKAVHYVATSCALVLAGAAAIVWSAVDRSRAHPRLYGALRVLVRYFVAAMMLNYGLVKVFKSQFPAPGPDRLLLPLGEMSPMGLLWTFMGHSAAYTVFTGLGEAIGGALLFFRRTTTLGALLVAAVMANVVMLNFSYDVPVKLFSSQLLLWSVFLVAPDGRRLANLFVLNRPVEPVALRRPFPSRGLERARLVLKCVVVGSLVAGLTISARSAYSTWGDGAPKPGLYGVYEVEEFVRDGEPRPPLLTDAARWRSVAVSRQGFLVVRHMDDRLAYYTLEEDASRREVTLTLPADPGFRARLGLTRPDPERLVLEGRIGEDALALRLRRVDESSFPLLSRGFRWIAEAPFNR